MRWGRWYLHDENTVAHIALIDVRVRIDMLDSPAHIVSMILDGSLAALDQQDIAHLMIAANELCWSAFDMTGMGDWTDENGKQLGRGCSFASAG